MSTQSDVLTAVKNAISALGLGNMEQVAVRTAPSDKGQFYPGITVHPVAEREFIGTNERDDIGYGIQVTMVVNDDNDLDEADVIGNWRQKIRKGFIHKKIAAVSNNCTVLVEHGPVYEPNKHDQKISTLILRVIVRETRG